jgi:transposase InsO family protein
MAEAFSSLINSELIRNPATRPNGGWKSVNYVELAIAEYVDWFNHRRLYGEIGHVPPAEFEANHYSEIPASPRQAPSYRVSTKPGAIQLWLPGVR